MFDAWACHRNSLVAQKGTQSSEKYVLVPPLSAEISADALDFWLSIFVCEVRRQDGTLYPAMSLKNLCIGIWRYLRQECERYDLNFMDTTNYAFVNFRSTLDGVINQINSKGVGIDQTTRAEPITPVDEEKLWSTGTFSLDNSRGLLNPVYFYNC